MDERRKADFKSHKKVPKIIELNIKATYEKLKETKKCQLCGKTSNVQMYCGGPWTWLHPKCGELAEKAIDDYLLHMSRHPYEYMINAMHELVHRRDGSED